MKAVRFAPRFVIVGLVVAALLAALAAPASAVTYSKINGDGSSYVALAIQQWVADAQSRGLPVNYLPTSSPDGLTSYASGLIDFAATEAEYSALFASSVAAPAGSRGYQYVPDVAGATAIMYHVQDRAGRAVDYLHLSMPTIAKIFMGYITNWDDPAISADNKGLELPDQPITVVYRSGQSGTTGTFYDFVAHAEPALFAQWAAKYSLPTNVRIIQLDGTPDFAPKTIAFGGSDQVGQYIASSNGLWSIGYDEFGYAKVYNVPTAWVENASGHWVQPYAANISAALETATLRPDLSQELSGVYSSQNPLAYPISAYSYLVTQCAPAADRQTCTQKYPNAGITNTLAAWMSYIECDGQISMAQIGYSPLPPSLSQEMSNSIARMEGTQPIQLTAANCSNPRFHGSLGAGATSPPDPLQNVPTLSPGPTATSPGGSTAPATGSDPSGSSAPGAASGPGASDPKGGAARAGGGTTSATGVGGTTPAGVKTNGGAASNPASDLYRAAAPVAYDSPSIPSPTSLLPWVLVAAVVGPPLAGGFWWRARRRRRPSRRRANAA